LQNEHEQEIVQKGFSISTIHVYTVHVYQEVNMFT